MRLEDLLLLCCATTHVGPERKGRMKELVQGEIDWSYLIRLSKRHGVLPLLYKNLKENASGRVPEAIMDELHNLFRVNTVHNLLLTSRLFRVLDLFKSNNISAIPYKGPTLSVLAYGDIDFRQFSDIDLILHQQDVIKAKEILLLDGYKPEKHLTPRQEAVYLKNECEYDFYSSDGRVLVELHWRVVQPYHSCPIDIEALWSHLMSVSLLGREVMTPYPEELLLILCAHHGGKHQWEVLEWICDVAQLVLTHQEMDWDRVMKQAARSGVQRMLYLGLYLAEDLLGTVIPEKIKAGVHNRPMLKSIAAQVQSRIFNEMDNEPGEMERFLFHLRMKEHLRDKLQYGVRRLFTSTENDWYSMNLPAPLFPLYRLFRPFRLARKYIPILLRR